MSAVTSISDYQNSDVEACYLLIEDNPYDAELVSALIESAFDYQVEVQTVSRFEQALQLLAQKEYDAIFLDMNLPDHSGLCNVEYIDNMYPQLPIVVLTNNNDDRTALRAINYGAQDYLSKNEVTPEILARSLRYAQERKNIEIRLKIALDESANRNIQLEKLARHDFLTSLPNRAYFDCAALKMLKRASRHKKCFSLVYFDINKFKTINDSFGHSAGDELLRQVATRARKIVRETDFLARMGGDEFAIVTDMIEERSEVYALVTRLLSCFNEVYRIDNQDLNISTSIGVSFFPDADSLGQLIRQADLSMHEAKSRKQDVCFFTQEMEKTYARSIQIRANLRSATKNTEFHCEFQGYYSKQSDGRIYTEALARWQSPILGEVAPNEFIPVVEHGPLNNHLTRAIVGQCGLLADMARSNNIPIGRINVNVSASQLCEPSFVRQLFHWIHQADIDPNILCLELIEREMVQNISNCGAHIQALRKEGIAIALDDFGSGYSSITHLISLPIDVLKLDRMLVKNIDQSPKYQALNAGIVDMAHRLEMAVIAEGIETAEEYAILKSLGCDYFQGFYFSRPQPAEVFINDCQRHLC